MFDRRVGQLRPLTKEDRGCQPEQSTGWLLRAFLIVTSKL
jgi:hypothetical protein